MLYLYLFLQGKNPFNYQEQITANSVSFTTYLFSFSRVLCHQSNLITTFLTGFDYLGLIVPLSIECYIIFKLKDFLRNKTNLIFIPLHTVHIKCEFTYEFSVVEKEKSFVTLVCKYILRSAFSADLNGLTKFQLI